MAKVMVGKASDIGAGTITHITAGGQDIMVANIDGKFYAAGNTCTHAGAELHEGTIEGKILTCPWHGAKWDLTTGEMSWFPQKLKSIGSYKVTVEGGTVYVEV